MLVVFIELYNFIPEIKNHKYTTIQINMTKDGKDLVLVIDPNVEHGQLTFKDMFATCATKRKSNLKTSHIVSLSRNS